MKYQIAIPSYKRSVTLCEKTLAYLLKTDVDFKYVTVFVADQEEKKDYTTTLTTIKKKVRVVVGKHTLRGQRNFIRSYYREGECVLFMDDDLDGVFYATTPKHSGMKLVTSLNSFVSNAFSTCKKFKISLWGISAVCNPFFMYKNGVTFDLKYVIGAFYGEVIEHGKSLDVELEDKEDFERTIKHFIHCGKILRFNEYAPKTKYYKEAGGMQVTRTKERVEESAKFLLRKYPLYCKLNTAKKNKEYTEIKLIKR